MLQFSTLANNVRIIWLLSPLGPTSEFRVGRQSVVLVLLAVMNK
jgi:hypothetical protein